MTSTLLALLFLGGASAQTWIQLPDFPGTARDDAASFSYYCKVYVGTGLQVGWTPTNDWWQYDVVQSTWQQVASLPATPRQYSTGVAINDIGYVFGGLDAVGPLDELWAYDTTTDEWTTRASLPGPGRYACASFTADNKLYIVGGLIDGGVALSELWEYDPALDEWNQRTSLPGVARHRATAIGQPDWQGGGAFVIGGADSEYVPLDEVWNYSTDTDQWEQLASLPEGRYGASAGMLNDRIGVVAGQSADGLMHADALTYNATLDSWEPFEAILPSERRGGVIGDADCPGWYYALYGTGIDSTFERRSDWYMTGYGFSVPEFSLDHLNIFPNPAHDRITLRLPERWSGALLTLSDATGRAVLSVPYQSGAQILLHALPPGTYSILAENHGQRAIGHFIAIP